MTDRAASTRDARHNAADRAASTSDARHDSDGSAGDSARRGIAAGLVGRSLWLAALWTAVGAAFVCAVVAIVAVAVCWLPAAGAAGNAGSAIRAGLLTFLAGLHGGITVAGTPAAFVPLGITVAIGAVAWRSGTALADVAADLGETDPTRLLGAAGLQLLTFATTAAVIAAFAGLGTTSVGPIAAALGGALLWALTGGLAVVRHTALADRIERSVSWWWATVLRVAVAALAVYVGVGALLSAASVGMHWHQVSALSDSLGGGWSGVPILLLGVLSAPNAAVAAAGYLSGPGFAVGTNTAVRLGSTAHGTLPAFPVLGALPSHPAGGASWLLVAVTPLVAGGCLTALVRRTGRQRARPLRQWRDLGMGLFVAAVLATVLAWAAGGGIGNAGLATVGVSSWQFGLAVAVGSGAGSAVVLGAVLTFCALRDRHPDAVEPPLRATLSVLRGEPAAPAGSREPTQEDSPQHGAATHGRKGDELAG